MKTYKNPFLFENQWSENECGDPFIMRFDGLYYLYCSSAGDHIKCWTSENLVDFNYEGSVCDDPIIYGAYAPEVTYYKGRFYMITSPCGSGHYLLEAEKPTGPFRIISDNYGLKIDGSFFVDDDGKQYMLRAGHNGIVIHAMESPEVIDVNGDIIKEAFLNYWTEGPMIIKRNGLYYLTYTGNHLLSKGYRVAYSVSDTAPNHGYVNLKNRTLLLETRPEFHALGHSSSFLAPDLDSYCIAYHSYELDVNPKKRRTCIDRLFFNGSRMYCNPIWWEQTAHKMPDFSCRGVNQLQSITLENSMYYVTPVNTANCYTAEVNIKPEQSSVCLIYGLHNERYGSIQLENNKNYRIMEVGKIKTIGTLNDAISFEGNITIRVAKKQDGFLDIYINNMHLCEFESELREGALAVLADQEQKIGYIAISKCVEGNEDKFAYKAIPGRFDAVHCKEEIEKIEFKDSGLAVFAGNFRKGKQYTYSVNVKATGYYKLIARIRQTADEYKMKLFMNNEQTWLSGSFTGLCDEEGYEIVTVGDLHIEKGLSQLTLEVVGESLIIDYFELTESSQSISCEVIKEGRLVTDHLQIMGHKKSKSMIHKYSGFTCAENHGIGFIGDTGMSDYKIASIINMNDKSTGDISVFVRATRESWFGAQVKEALFGYRIKVSKDGIDLYRESYDEKQLMFYSFQGLRSSKIKLDIEVIRSTIVICVNEKSVITFEDPTPYLYGRIGMEVTGEGFGFEHFSICQ